MKKTIKILSIILAISFGISFLSAIAGLTFFWEPVSLMCFSGVIEEGPIVPIGDILYILGCLTIFLIIIFSAKSKRFLAIEIISMISLSVILPFAAWFISIIQQHAVNSLGMDAAISLMIARKALVFPVSLAKFSSALLLVVCGMRIVDKINHKKQSQ